MKGSCFILCQVDACSFILLSEFTCNFFWQLYSCCFMLIHWRTFLPPQIIRLQCTMHQGHSATHCNTLQHTATQSTCSMSMWHFPCTKRCVSNLRYARAMAQRTATHCNALQHTAAQSIPNMSSWHFPCTKWSVCDARCAWAMVPSQSHKYTWASAAQRALESHYFMHEKCQLWCHRWYRVAKTHRIPKLADHFPQKSHKI